MRLMLSICFTIVFCMNGYSQSIFNQILDNGPRTNRLNIVIIAEGYTAAQQADFEVDASDFLDYMLTISPFSEYTNYYNGFTIYVESNESGSDHPDTFIFRDTYFNSTFDSYNIQRLITIPPNDFNNRYSDGQGKVDDLLAQYIPEYDIVILLCNDPVYGGSGGVLAISSTHSSAPEIVVHEVGHSFGNLADEYDYGKYATLKRAEAPNVTQETNRDYIKWRDWILPSTPVPTPETPTYGSVVGLFEGANYQPTGWYRPELYCKMQTLGPDFCEICKEQLVRIEYYYLNGIDSYTPTTNLISILSDQTTTLSVSTLTPNYHDLSIQWFVNDDPIDGAINNSFIVDGSVLGQGSHAVKVEIVDLTSLVRVDYSGYLDDSRIWTVDVTGIDSDGDGWFDYEDNCVNLINVFQEDEDNDNVGDACDNCPLIANPDQTDLNNDGRGDICEYICGDINNSGDMPTISDLTFLVDYMFNNGEAPFIIESADLDQSGQIGISDITFFVAYLFGGGPPPTC